MLTRLPALFLICLTPLFAANVVTYDLNQEFSGGASPGSSVRPWLTATFADVAGGVLLTMQASNLLAGEFVSNWYFNLNPSLNANSLTFSYVAATSGQQAQSISKGTNCCKADGGGFYDLAFAYSTSGARGGANKFTGGEVSTYLISGISGLTASAFNYVSSQSGGNGVWHTAAHVQGIATGAGSGFIGGSPVPEPTSLFLGGSVAAVLGLGLWRRRRSPARSAPIA